MKNKLSDARSQNLLHEARVKSSHIENEIDDAENELSRLRSKKSSLALGKKLVNSKGKLESHEIEESKQFRDLQDKFNEVSSKHEKSIADARMGKLNQDSLLKEIIRVLEVSLHESTVVPSRRDFLVRKIQKLKAGDIASLPSILVDLTYC